MTRVVAADCTFVAPQTIETKLTELAGLLNL